MADYQTIQGWVGRDWEGGTLEFNRTTSEELGGVILAVKRETRERYNELCGIAHTRAVEVPEIRGIPTLSELIEHIERLERRVEGTHV